MKEKVNINDIIPFLRDGWVACDETGIWNWYAKKPKIGSYGFYRNGYVVYPLFMFGLAPFDGDWKDSLIKIGEPEEGKGIEEDATILETKKMAHIVLEKMEEINEILAKKETEQK